MKGLNRHGYRSTGKEKQQALFAPYGEYQGRCCEAISPDMIQTDNGGEFTHTQKTSRIYPLDVLCSRLHIVHKTIRPKTPWHNGKVERSHRNDQERFYNHLSFYSYEDLQLQMKRY